MNVLNVIELSTYSNLCEFHLNRLKKKSQTKGIILKSKMEGIKCQKYQFLYLYGSVTGPYSVLLFLSIHSQTRQCLVAGAIWIV